MRGLKGLLVFASVLMVLGGCIPMVEEAPPVEVRGPSATDGSLTTDRATYAASCRGSGISKSCTVPITLTYTNPTGSTLYFDTCSVTDSHPGYFVGGLTDEGTAYNPAGACESRDRFVKVLPRASRVDTAELSGPNFWDEDTGQPLGLFEGRIQVFYKVYTCSSAAEACGLPAVNGTSNVFTVTVPD